MLPATTPLEGTVVRRRVGAGRDGTGAEEGHRSPAVLRHELDQSGMQGGTDELSGAEPERPFDAEPTLLERLAVQLGEQHALGEVERADRDGVVAEGVRRDRCASSSSAHAAMLSSAAPTMIADRIVATSTPSRRGTNNVAPWLAGTN